MEDFAAKNDYFGVIVDREDSERLGAQFMTRRGENYCLSESFKKTGPFISETFSTSPSLSKSPGNYGCAEQPTGSLEIRTKGKSFYSVV